MPRDLLYEIGVEEIPASFVLPALAQLEKSVAEGLRAQRLEFGDICTYGTPRRLTIIVRGVSDGQPDIEQEYKGPPADRAFDEDGNPTKAGEGFAKSRGVAVDQLEVREDDKGKWVFVNVLEPGKPAAEILSGLLEEATLGLGFPKTMHWADLDLRFARPLRWLVALLGDEIVDLEIAEVKAGNTSRGHRFLSSDSVVLSGAENYLNELRDAYVMADHGERRRLIAEAANAAAEQVGGKARIDEDLLTEVSFLIEWPTCLCGKFDEQYLQLPDPVIVTVMQGHQRYFPVENADGKLLPYFITVRNGDDQGLDTVRAGNEKVIVPRLADAEFYLTEDLKQTLDERAESLARVTFMEGLGTLADKTARIGKIVGALADALPEFSAGALDTARRAAHLSKADLVTLMVGDSKLGELQGIIGGEYASRQGEDANVAAAVAEHYRPAGAGDALPETAAGTLVSIADKIDNLAASFRLGAIPTGSNDPFALRRQAQGIVEMLLRKRLGLNLPELVRLAAELIPEPNLEREKDAAKVLSPEAAADALVAFFGQRVDHFLTQEGVTYDVSRAALGSEWTSVLEVFERAVFLKGLRARDAALFDSLVTAGERPARITRPEELPVELEVDAGLFEKEWESKLWAASSEAKAAVGQALSADPRDYDAAAAALASLSAPIHEFFEDVMVMVDDEKLRNNRLAMLRDIDSLFMGLADFLQIVREGE